MHRPVRVDRLTHLRLLELLEEFELELLDELELELLDEFELELPAEAAGANAVPAARTPQTPRPAARVFQLEWCMPGLAMMLLTSGGIRDRRSVAGAGKTAMSAT
jgi:hypothetical protein